MSPGIIDLIDKAAYFYNKKKVTVRTFKAHKKQNCNGVIPLVALEIYRIFYLNKQTLMLLMSIEAVLEKKGNSALTAHY